MKTTIKNQSNGINEERRHSCDLKDESFAHGAVKRSILRKTDHFSHHYGKKQNFFVKSNWGFFTTFPVSKCTIYAFEWSGAIIGIIKGGPIKKKIFQVP